MTWKIKLLFEEHWLLDQVPQTSRKHIFQQSESSGQICYMVSFMKSWWHHPLLGPWSTVTFLYLDTALVSICLFLPIFNLGNADLSSLWMSIINVRFPCSFYSHFGTECFLCVDKPCLAHIGRCTQLEYPLKKIHSGGTVGWRCPETHSNVKNKDHGVSCPFCIIFSLPPPLAQIMEFQVCQNHYASMNPS